MPSVRNYTALAPLYDRILAAGFDYVALGGFLAALIGRFAPGIGGRFEGRGFESAGDDARDIHFVLTRPLP